MQEVFDKLKQRIRICTTEACGYTPLTRVVSEAELKEIIEQIAAEYSNGHFGCNTNGEHERCDGCGLTDCKNRNKIWFCVGDDYQESNAWSNGWIPCSERFPKVEDLREKSVDDCTCYLIQRRGGIMDVAHYIKVYEEQYFEANAIKIKDIVAWQPLPDPYQPNACQDTNCPYNDRNECPAADGCAGYERKQTNADRVRSMSDEELAGSRVDRIDYYAKSDIPEYIGDFAGIANSIEEAIALEIKWLQSEVEE